MHSSYLCIIIIVIIVILYRTCLPTLLDTIHLAGWTVGADLEPVSTYLLA